MSEPDCNGLTETLYLTSSPKVKADILEGKNTPIDDCTSQEEIER